MKPYKRNTRTILRGNGAPQAFFEREPDCMRSQSARNSGVVSYELDEIAGARAPLVYKSLEGNFKLKTYRAAPTTLHPFFLDHHPS